MHEVCQDPEDRRMSLWGPMLECWSECPVLRNMSMTSTEHSGYDFLCLGPNYRALPAVRYSVLEGVRMTTRHTTVGVSQFNSVQSVFSKNEIVHHVELIASGIWLLWRFFHTRVQLV
jgi:hypothetical protein